MSTLTLPSPTALEPPPLARFFGRTLDEYSRFFDLNLVRLRRRAVLDVGAGPSSFAAEASRLGIDAVAVDPCYHESPTELAGLVRQDYARMSARIRAKPRHFRQKAFPSFDAAEADRRAAAQRFLAHFEGNLRHGRYVRGALPLLPFLDGAFDLVLCAHVLCGHTERSDLEWTLDACLELARVSGGEVRIHPLCGPDGRPYPELAELRAELLARGLPNVVRTLEYEFFAGGNSMLVLRPDIAAAGE